MLERGESANRVTGFYFLNKQTNPLLRAICLSLLPSMLSGLLGAFGVWELLLVGSRVPQLLKTLNPKPLKP